MTDDERLVVLIERMNKLLAMDLVRDLPLREKVVALDFAGFPPKEIAGIIGKTPNHVSVILHDLRKQQKEEVKRGEGTDSTPTDERPGEEA